MLLADYDNRNIRYNSQYDFYLYSIHTISQYFLVFSFSIIKLGGEPNE